MMMYLAKFILCSGLFYLAYIMLFESERMHQFKRFYLLFSLVLSFVIPLITFESQTRVLPEEVITNFTTSAAPASSPILTTTAKPEQPSSLPYVILGIYAGITSLLLARFMKNMISIIIKVRKGKKTVWKGVTLILNPKESVAYSFMNYIFVSEADYQNHTIHDGILQHELAHVQQKHSFDVVLIELLQIFLWFNPLLYFYRKAMQINHEYLADESVINRYQDLNTYQMVLINYISTQSGLSLTSQFNYLTIKKRLTMMSKTNSLRVALRKQLLLLPILALAIFLFSTQTSAQEEKKQTIGKKPEVLMQKAKSAHAPTQDGLSADERKEYQTLVDKFFAWTPKQKAEKVTRLEKVEITRLELLYKKMNEEQQAKANIVFWPPLKPMKKSIPSEKQLSLWKDSKMYGVWIDGKRIENAKLDSYQIQDFSHWSSSRLSKIALNYGKHYFQVDLMTNANYQTYYEDAVKNPKSQMIIRQGNFHAK